MFISLGSDPEFFLFNTETEHVVSAHNIIQGTKQEPFPIKKLGFLQVDGVACEVNTVPALTAPEFSKNLTQILSALSKHVKKNNPKLNVIISSTVTFEKDYFKNLPENVKVLGCDPDYNAYTGEMTELPKNHTTSRSAGGHLHIGWLHNTDVILETQIFNPEHLSDCCNVVKQLDAVFIVLSHIWDKDNERRNSYGQKGTFRPKPFGVEYRTLSNQWTVSTEMMQWIFKTVEHCVILLSQNTKIFDPQKNALISMINKEPSFAQITNYYRMLKNAFNIPPLPQKMYAKFLIKGN